MSENNKIEQQNFKVFLLNFISDFFPLKTKTALNNFL